MVPIGVCRHTKLVPFDVGGGRGGEGRVETVGIKGTALLIFVTSKKEVREIKHHVYGKRQTSTCRLSSAV